jgi:hypothetical protein
MKLRLRFPRVILLIAGVAVAYHWLGPMNFAIGLVVFVLYELFMPPPRYRIFGPEQAQEAADNRFGILEETTVRTNLRQLLTSRRETSRVPAAAA